MPFEQLSERRALIAAQQRLAESQRDIEYKRAREEQRQKFFEEKRRFHEVLRATDLKGIFRLIQLFNEAIGDPTSKDSRRHLDLRYYLPSPAYRVYTTYGEFEDQLQKATNYNLPTQRAYRRNDLHRIPDEVIWHLLEQDKRKIDKHFLGRSPLIPLYGKKYDISLNGVNTFIKRKTIALHDGDPDEMGIKVSISGNGIITVNDSAEVASLADLEQELIRVETEAEYV